MAGSGPRPPIPTGRMNPAALVPTSRSIARWAILTASGPMCMGQARSGPTQRLWVRRITCKEMAHRVMPNASTISCALTATPNSQRVHTAAYWTALSNGDRPYARPIIDVLMIGPQWSVSPIRYHQIKAVLGLSNGYTASCSASRALRLLRFVLVQLYRPLCLRCAARRHSHTGFIGGFISPTTSSHISYCPHRHEFSTAAIAIPAVAFEHLYSSIVSGSGPSSIAQHQVSRAWTVHYRVPAYPTKRACVSIANLSVIPEM
mgnify:CR=1 FL=1